jgi:hypothetical protein
MMVAVWSSVQLGSERSWRRKGRLEFIEMHDVTGALIGRRAPESKENIGHFDLMRRLGRFTIPRCSLTKTPFMTSNLAIPWSFEPAGLQPR